MKIERYKKQDRFTDSCYDCGRDIEKGDVYFLIENRVGERSMLCPDCAAIYLAETLDAVSREFEFINDIMGA